jgi:hypothetical protein
MFCHLFKDTTWAGTLPSHLLVLRMVLTSYNFIVLSGSQPYLHQVLFNLLIRVFVVASILVFDLKPVVLGFLFHEIVHKLVESVSNCVLEAGSRG